MRFTPLHKALGLEPSEQLSDAILDSAVDEGVSEGEDLDWKQRLPDIRSLSTSDVKKDIAAMANSGGGMIVYGVEESQSKAVARHDPGEFDERYESTYRRVAINKISPPVFGLRIDRLGDNKRAIAVEVLASSEVPHLVQYDDRFGAPVRNGSDTVWMNERQIEAMYRARFDERRRAVETLDGYYAEAMEQIGPSEQPWLIAVAHPRVPDAIARPDREAAKAVFKNAAAYALTFARRLGTHVFDATDHTNPRAGFRRWTAMDQVRDKERPWCGAWASVHHDGSVSLVAPVGGLRVGQESACEPHDLMQWELENAVADLAALVRACYGVQGHDDYDVQIGIEWTGTEELRIFEVGWGGHAYAGRSIPLRRYSPVRTTLSPAMPTGDFQREVSTLAEDCINQGGLTELAVIKKHDDAE